MFFVVLLCLFGSDGVGFPVYYGDCLGLVNSAAVYLSYPLGVFWFGCYWCWIGLVLVVVGLWLLVFWFMILGCVA